MALRAFTLIELLVVIVIIGLLLALLVTGGEQAWRLTRITECAINLRHIHEALRIAQFTDDKGSNLGAGAGTFCPEKPDWPFLAALTVEGRGIFRCPEDERTGDIHDPTFDVMYRSCVISGDDAFIPFDPTHYLCVSRTGVDEEGQPYTEYCIEDVPTSYTDPYDGQQYIGAKWSGQENGVSENDGVWRITRMPNGKRKLELMSCTCGMANELWYRGRLLWTNLRSHIGEEIVLGSMFTSYGLNCNVCAQPIMDSGTIIVLDFHDTIADPTATTIVPELDDPDSGRHGGHMNVLFADGRVELFGASELYPQVCPDLWTP